MKNISKRLLKILSITSVSTLSIITTSCKFSNTTNRQQISNKDLEKKVDEIFSNSNNHVDNKDINKHDSTNTTINKHSYSTTSNQSSQTSYTIPNESYTIPTYNPSLELQEIDNKYLNETVQDFKPIITDQNKIKSMILNNSVSSNFYSHSQFGLQQDEITLDSIQNKTFQFKLIDKNTNKEVDNSKVKWYQRTFYPQDQVFEANHSDNLKELTFELKDNGIVNWIEKINSDGSKPEITQARIFAEYEGYLYSGVVKVISREMSTLLNNEDLAKKEAKRIVEYHKWKSLPTLERLKAAYEWIIANVKYDHNMNFANLPKNQNAHSALIELHTVCAGYSKGLKLLLEELNIPVKFSEGYSARVSLSDKHAWNQVQIDGDWYYLDSTSDTTIKKNDKDRLFFLNTADDFLKADKKDPETKQKRLRNLLFKNYVGNKDDVLALIDKNFDENNGKMNKLVLWTKRDISSPNYSHIHDALKERNLDNFVSHTNYIRQSKGYNIGIEYLFNYKSNSVKQIQVTTTKDDEAPNAIKIKLNEEVKDLKPGNFNITNALIREVKHNDKTYTLYLDHFKSIGDVEVKLESIKRKDYKFTLSGNNTFKFKTEIKEPKAEVKVLGDGKIEVKTDDKDLEYNFNNNDWQDLPENKIIDRITAGNLYIRFKNTSGLITSEIKTINIKKHNIYANQLKVIGRTIIGVDQTMEYKLKDSNNWISIDKNKLTVSTPGTYEIRVKSTNDGISSDSEIVVIH